MLNIVICEDNFIEREKIEKFICTSIEKNRYNCKISMATANPGEVLEFSKSHYEDINIYFLDVDLNSEINGFDIARTIRKNDINCYFIFITGHMEFSMMTFKYKLQALDYINKSEPGKLSSRIDECMSIVYNEYLKFQNQHNGTSQTIPIKSGTRQYNLNSKDILYFETTSDHRIKVHTISNSIEYYGTMKEIISILSENDFCQVHKGYIVNVRHITEVNYKEMRIVMSNGDFCHMSRSYSKELVKKCI